tara:strand:+ start:31 stop:342 length:312 start_codon:yes stop_codon:yes gene_type:complete
MVGIDDKREKEHKKRVNKLKAKVSKIRLAIAGEDILKKNKIKRDIAKDTGGSDYEQNMFDSLTKMLSKDTGGKPDDVRRNLQKSFSKGKRNKKDGTFSFTYKE